MEKTELKNIVILATGGTIAGKASSGTQMTGYTAGAYSVADLLAGVPELGELAHISGEQLCNIDSSSITDALLLRLAQRCNELLAQNDVDGVVITHGTDTMEETAFFLNLTVKSAKPVVLVGAMRPATAVSADGPLNIINAVKVAVDAASTGQGVLVMMNDEIYSGRDVTKTNTANVATFKATNGGPLGFIVGGEVHYYYRSVRPHTLQSEFDVTGVTVLPRVDIIYTHIGEDRVFVDAALAAGARGIIYAGSGMGSIHEDVEAALSYPDLNVVGCEIIAFDAQTDLFSDACIQKIHDKNLYAWVNAITLGDVRTKPLYAKLDDDVSILQDPALGWGKLFEKKIDIIQTDWPAILYQYRQKILGVE